MLHSKEIFGIEMEEVPSKKQSKDFVLESKEVTQILKKGEEKRKEVLGDYPRRYLGQNQFLGNVDSSNLSSFIKIQRVDGDALFGLKHHKGRGNRRKISLDDSQLGEGSATTDTTDRKLAGKQKFRRMSSLDETQLRVGSSTSVRPDQSKLSSFYSLPDKPLDEKSHESVKISEEQPSESTGSSVHGRWCLQFYNFH